MLAILSTSNKKEFDDFISDLNKSTLEWEMAAARGECGWICADCSCSFPEGMPDECIHGHESCTNIIKRDKERATNES